MLLIAIVFTIEIIVLFLGEKKILLNHSVLYSSYTVEFV